jgi:hypothetical protein
MRGDIPPLPQYALMAWCLVKHRDNFTSALFSISTSSTLFSRVLKVKKVSLVERRALIRIRCHVTYGVVCRAKEQSVGIVSVLYTFFVSSMVE